MKQNKFKFYIYIVLIIIGIYIYTENSTGIFLRKPHPKKIIFEKFNTPELIDQPLILAHRGSRYLLPENTLIAFKTAIDLGADVVETDVVSTKDGEIIVYHDKVLDRTTEKTGEISSYTLKEIQSFDAAYRFSPDNGTTYPYRGKGIKIPTLKQLFYEIPSDVQLNIEIKEDSEEVADKVWRLILDAWQNTDRKHGSIVIGSRYCAPTQKIRNLATLYKRFYKLKQLPIATSACERDVTKFIILSHLYLSKFFFSYFPIDSYEVLQIPAFSGAIRLDGNKVIQSASYFGIHIHYWVINSNEELNRLSNISISGVITDRTDRAVKIFKEHGWKPKNLKVPLPLPGNSTGTYFIPDFDIDDSHTCVSITCLLLQKADHIVISLVLAYVVYRVLKRKI